MKLRHERHDKVVDTGALHHAVASLLRGPIVRLAAR